MPHLYASDPGISSERRPELAPCPHCCANGAACDSLYWLEGHRCCRPCTGNHREGALMLPLPPQDTHKEK